ncbi:MAG: ABC transporter substrate-binding protein [Deltaproteobacteria bacterium]|nr:ABC transporter substrate-binding protein [Deltaproteobacteria bacterium]
MRSRIVWSSLFVAFLTLGLISVTGPIAAADEEINIGAINDMTGATSDVGKDYALGVKEAFTWINETGGINGKKIKLYQYDYGYRIPEAVTLYKKLKNYNKVVAILGWGTGDTESLSPTVTKDKIPYISGSYSAHLADPKKTPYNLFFAADYSTSARAAITAWYDEVWMKDAKFKERRDKKDKPRFVCFYAFPAPYASAPIKAIKDQAALLGFEVGPDQDISLTALDCKSQVLGAKSFKPDLVWHGNTTMSVAAAMRDAYALGLGANHIINVWGFDENLPRLAAEAAEGAIGVTTCAFFGQKVDGMDNVLTYAKKVNPSIPLDKRLIRTIQGWGAVLVLKEALMRADKKGPLTGESILKQGFETIKDLNLGLGIPPVSYSATDHRPSPVVNIYQYKGGKFSVLEKVDLKARWPENWQNKWLGW